MNHPMMMKMEKPEGMPEDVVADVTAESLSERLAQTIDELKAILDDAKSAGIYNDRGSVNSMKQLIMNAEEIKANWMETEAAPEEDAAAFNPAKLIEQVAADRGPLSGPTKPQEGERNPFGGQVFKVKSPNYGLK